MAKAEEKVRSFSGSDADMIQASRVMQGLFVEDKIAFTNFDSEFADPFAENWLQKIEAGNTVAQDSLYVSGQTELTKNVELKMTESRDFFQMMKYFIEKAFPNRKEIWTQFGVNDYDKARTSETKMIQFLGVLHKTAVEFKTELIAAGFSQEKIDKIAALLTELINADYEQEMSKKKRPAITQERIEKLNECYSIMQKVSKAGKIIFANNRAKYDQYLLPIERIVKKPEEPAPATP
ncbi:MAG: hypothetical protein ACYC6D_00625 [Melioribacteraceae bacterium]